MMKCVQNRGQIQHHLKILLTSGAVSQTSVILNIFVKVNRTSNRNPLIYYQKFFLIIIDFWLLIQWLRFIAIVYDKVLEAKSKIHHSQEVLKQFDLFRITLSSEPSLDFSAFFSSSWDCFTAFNSFSNCLHSILAWISCCHK